jgi:hypothetical protein
VEMGAVAAEIRLQTPAEDFLVFALDAQAFK